MPFDTCESFFTNVTVNIEIPRIDPLNHVRNELLKLNNIQFREKNLIIEAARSKMKTAKTIAKSNHSTRPQVVVNRFPEHQDVFNGSKLVPGEISYTSVVKSTGLIQASRTV